MTATDPAGGERVPKGSKVRVNVTSGPATAAVPSVVGLSVDAAQAKLHAAGFNGNPTFVDNSTAPQGQVISQNPAPGTTATKGTTVNLKVSNGPPQVSVPDVVGYTSQQAVSDARGRRLPGQPAVPVDGREPGQHRPVAEPDRQLPGDEGLAR